MNGTVYQGSLIRRYYCLGGVNMQLRHSPVGLQFGTLRAELFRDWLDLVVFDPHGFVRQLLVVEGVTNRAGH